VAIGFSLGRPASVDVTVFNRAGRMVRQVASGLSLPGGAGVVHWDGKDRDGRVVEEGLYIVTVEALGERQTQTLAVLR
jgi:flagellar hook assembly protein FlgD